MSDPQNPRDDDCELNYTKAPWIAEARQVVAQLWCKPDTSHLVMEPALCEHIVQLVAGLKIEIAVAKAENFSAVLNSAESKEPLEIKMNNNQNWPDSAFLESGNYWSPIKRDDSVEYYSADKVREIQLATIVKAFAMVLYELARSGKFGQLSTGEILDSIDPQSIIEQVKI